MSLCNICQIVVRFIEKAKIFVNKHKIDIDISEK